MERKHYNLAQISLLCGVTYPEALGKGSRKGHGHRASEWAGMSGVGRTEIWMGRHCLVPANTYTALQLTEEGLS